MKASLGTCIPICKVRDELPRMANRAIKSRPFLRTAGQLAVALCIFGIPGSAHASNNCPWINEATVSGLLDGPAVGAFNQGSVGQPATCNFVFKTASGSRFFTINVETVQDAHARMMSLAKGCKEPQEVLPSIGNEAYICTTEHDKEAVAERVVGRVRDQVFTILISTAGKGDLLLSTQDLKSRISVASEQVSGNLY
jgi:hypothetical protein